MGIHEELKNIINSEKIDWIKVLQLITKDSINQIKNKKTPLQLVLKCLAGILEGEKKQKLFQNHDTANKHVKIKIEKNKKESVKQFISLEEKKKRCIKIIYILIKQGANLGVCQNLITSEITKLLSVELTYEELCHTFEKCYIQIGNLVIISKKSTKKEPSPYISFKNDKVEKVRTKIQNENYGIYIDENTDVGPKFHISIDPKPENLKKGCNIIKNILIKNDIYSFKFAKLYEKTQEGKQFVIYSHFYPNKDWAKVLKEIENGLKNKVKPHNMPKENAKVSFLNNESKYISWRNDYFKKDYYNLDFFSKVSSEFFNRLILNKKFGLNYFILLLKIREFPEILNYIPNMLRQEAIDKLIEAINKITPTTDSDSGTDRELSGEFDDTPNVLKGSDTESEGKIEEEEEGKQKILMKKKNEKLDTALKYIKEYMQLVENRKDCFKKNLQEDKKLELAVKAISDLKNSDTLKNDYNELLDLMIKKSEYLKNIFFIKIKNKLSFEKETCHNINDFTLKNKNFMKNFMRYRFKFYKENRLYYLPAELASSVATILQKKYNKVNLAPYNPFEFKILFKTQLKKHYKKKKMKLKKKQI